MTQITDPAGQISAPDVVSPLASKMLFWRARYTQRSDFLHHLPFVFWLVEAMRPARTLVLGLSDGVAHFAICQAVDKLDLATRCQAIGQWPVPVSGPSSGPSSGQNAVPADPAPSPADLTGSVPPEISHYNTTNYAEFSTIMALDQSTALGRTPAGSIDLLCIDLAMTMPVLDALTYAWPTKLSRNGVILLHGTSQHFSSPEAQEFLTRMQQTYPTISFAAGTGLLAILWGPDQPYRLAKLAGADPAAAGVDGTAEVKQIFTRLGLLHRLEWEGPHEAQQHQIAATALNLAQTDLTAAQTSLSDLYRAYEARNIKTALYQSRVYDLEQEKAAVLAKAQAQTDAALADQARLADLRVELSERSDQQDAAWQLRLQDQAADHLARLAARDAEWQSRLAARDAEWQSRLAAQTDKDSLQDIVTLTAALSQLQAEKHALIEAARNRRPDQSAAGADTPQDYTHSPLQRTGPAPRKKGLWARFKGSAVMAPVRYLRRRLRGVPASAQSSGARQYGQKPDLLTRFKRSGVMAPVRAVVRWSRRRKKDRQMQASAHAATRRSG